MVLRILGAVIYVVFLIVILSLMRASSAADKHAERVFPQGQAGQCELEQQKQK